MKLRFEKISREPVEDDGSLGSLIDKEWYKPDHYLRELDEAGEPTNTVWLSGGGERVFLRLSELYVTKRINTKYKENSTKGRLMLGGKDWSDDTGSTSVSGKCKPIPKIRMLGQEDDKVEDRWELEISEVGVGGLSLFLPILSGESNARTMMLRVPHGSLSAIASSGVSPEIWIDPQGVIGFYTKETRIGDLWTRSSDILYVDKNLTCIVNPEEYSEFRENDALGSLGGFSMVIRHNVFDQSERKEEQEESIKEKIEQVQSGIARLEESLKERTTANMAWILCIIGILSIMFLMR